MSYNPLRELAMFKHCKKCDKDIDTDLFGSQRYCRGCWAKYKAARQEARRLEDVYTIYPHLRPTTGAK